MVMAKKSHGNTHTLRFAGRYHFKSYRRRKVFIGRGEEALVSSRSFTGQLRSSVLPLFCWGLQGFCKGWLNVSQRVHIAIWYISGICMGYGNPATWTLWVCERKRFEHVIVLSLSGLSRYFCFQRGSEFRV